MRFNDIGLKDLVLDFDSNDLQDITIVQGDTKTRGFKVLVSTNNGEIIKASSQYEMRLYGVNSNYPDKSFFTKGTIDGDFYKVYISTDMASKSGKLQLQLALFEGTNALIQSRIKEVDVYTSIANGGNVGKDLVVDFGKLQDALAIAEKQQKKFDESLIRQESIESDLNKTKTEVRQFRDELKDVLTTENARIEAEKKRVSAEQIRSNQEEVRQQLEITRQSSENARQSNESTRQSNEQQRQAEESTRKSEEQKRITAETNRDNAETKRDSAEKQRTSNEDARVKAETTRKENDATYSKNEQQRQTNEQQRQTQEQQRVDAERLRQSQEDLRNQLEDTRESKEKTRQEQEQQRVEAEKNRVSQETTREESEKTRTSKETERQSNESTRQSNENTRKEQENARVEAEKQRVDAEAARVGKFAAWDKTMQGVIPTATSTTAGIMRIDTDGETVAASRKTVDGLKEEYTGFKGTVSTNITSLNDKIQKAASQEDLGVIRSDLAGAYTEIDNTQKIANKNSNSISDLSTNVDEKLELKADKKDVEESVNQINETINQLNTGFDEELKLKANKKDVDESVKTLTEWYASTVTTFNAMDSRFNDVKSKISTNKTEIDNTKKIANTNASDLSNLQAKVNNLSTDKISNKNGGSLSFWSGTQSEYDKISSKDSNTIYFIMNNGNLSVWQKEQDELIYNEKNKTAYEIKYDAQIIKANQAYRFVTSKKDDDYIITVDYDPDKQRKLKNNDVFSVSDECDIIILNNSRNEFDIFIYKTTDKPNLKIEV